MKSLPNIELTKQQLYQMFKNPFDEGGESVVCHGSNQSSLYKIFIDRNRENPLETDGNLPVERIFTKGGSPTIASITDMSDNKFNKVKELYEMQLENSVRPLSTITSDGRLIGYEMTLDTEDIPLYIITPTREEAIHILKQTRDILQYYASKDITYGDVAKRNILINKRTGRSKFCDMDNIRLGRYPIDLMDKELKHYGEVRGIDETADAYMHNLLAIQLIAHNDYNANILSAICRKEYPQGFKWPARRIMRSMIEPEEFTGEYIVKYVKNKR